MTFSNANSVPERRYMGASGFPTVANPHALDRVVTSLSPILADGAAAGLGIKALLYEKSKSRR
jgi:hypothetical protein